MKRMYIWGLLFLLLLIVPVSGAKLSGFIYDQQLMVVRDVVIEINTTPNQRQISRTGGYSFDLNDGTYMISAYLTQNYVTRLIAQEEVTITGDGEYIVDLVVFPDIDLVQDFRPYWLIGTILLLIVLLVVAGYYIYRWRRKSPNIEYNVQYEHHESEEQPVVVEESISINYESDDDKLKKRILSLLKDNDGQLTQKEIRKKIPLSEAKISQVISDLAKERKIQKVKQGRSNIVVLRKKR